MTSDEKKELRGLRRKWGFVFWGGWMLGASVLWGGTGLFLAVLTFPLPVIAAHYFAKHQLAQKSIARREREQLDARAQAAVEAAEKGRRLALMEQSDRLARIKNARKEVIDKLGVVSDYLDLLSGTADKDRAILIVQNVKKDLRDLVAKYPIHDLAALIRGDEAIQLKLPALRDQLARLNVQSDEAQVIFEAMRRGLGGPVASGPAPASGIAPVSVARVPK